MRGQRTEADKSGDPRHPLTAIDDVCCQETFRQKGTCHPQGEKNIGHIFMQAQGLDMNRPFFSQGVVVNVHSKKDHEFAHGRGKLEGRHRHRRSKRYSPEG